MRRQGHDDQLRARGLHAHDPGRLEAIHGLHLDVHEDDVEGQAALHQRDGFFGIPHGGDDSARRTQQLGRDQPVHVVVLHQQHPTAFGEAVAGRAGGLAVQHALPADAQQDRIEQG